MKVRTILTLSLCLNFALFAGYWMKRPASAQPGSTDISGKAPDRPARTDESRFKREVQIITETQDFHWATVESEDYREYIANLRRIGCPEETVRDIIIADINKLYAAKMAALYPSARDFQFWRVRDRSARNEEREREQARLHLETEKRDLIKELLGVDHESDPSRLAGRSDNDEWRYGFLSPEKQAQVRALNDRFRELERSLFSEGGWSPENRAQYAALRAQREAELAQILTPDEFEQYLLRNSWTARNMRENLASFQPDEDEFRRIFELRKNYDDQFGFTRDGGDDAVREQRRLAQQQLDDQLRALLGEDRFRQYQLSQDERFRDIYDFTQRNNLPRHTAETIYDLRHAAEDARRRLEAQANVTEEARRAALQALAEETRLALNQTLGNSVNDYLRRDGRWVDRLARIDNERSSDGRGRYRRN